MPDVGESSLSANYAANRLAAAAFWVGILVALVATFCHRLIRRPLLWPWIRGVSYLRLRWNGALAWLSPPPVGGALALGLYWALLAVLSFYQVTTSAADSIEPVAFRFGWIAATQIPLAFLLVARWNPFTLLLAVAPDRLVSIHRWVCLTLIVMSTVHGGLFVDEYIKHDVFWMEIRIVPSLKDGFWAWGVLAWTALSTIPPIRRLSHELFILQHLVSAVAFLYFMLRHIGKKNTLLIWISLAILAADFATRLLTVAVCNLLARRGKWMMGFTAYATAVDEEMTTLTVSGVPFTWKTGQHVYIWVPRLPLHAPHPFTVTGTPTASDQTLQVVMRTKTGWTKGISRLASQEGTRLRVILAGPFGTTPRFQQYDIAVLISSSSGLSFSLSMLETLGHLREVFVLAIVRRRSHLKPYLEALRRHASGVAITVAVTSQEGSAADSEDACDEEEQWLNGSEDKESENPTTSWVQLDGRPDIDSYLREVLSGLPGRSIVSVCGGSSVTADVRGAVSSLARAGMDVTLHVEGSR